MKPLFITIGLFLLLTGISFAIGPKLLEKRSTNPPAGNNSWISSDGKCPTGYRTTYQTVQCINAPCPAQTICTKDALLQHLGGFGSFANLHGFSNTYSYLNN